MHPNELKNLLNKTADERADIAMNRIADSEEVWFIIDDESYFIPETGEGLPSLPIWSDFELAERYLLATGLEADWQIVSADLEDFLLDDVPTFIAENINIAIQPLHQQINAVCDAAQFARKINQVCIENYEEAFHLPYLA